MAIYFNAIIDAGIEKKKCKCLAVREVINDLYDWIFQSILPGKHRQN